MGKVASFTSISGPHLQYAGAFLPSARTPRAGGQVARQLVASGYIGFFLCPGVPELASRSGLGVKVVEAFERIGRSSTRSQRHATPRSVADYINGLNVYRANMPAPMLSPGPQLPKTAVAVRVLVPRRDIFVTPALQQFTGAIPVSGRVIPIEGGHWVVTSRPDVVARLTSEWVDQNAGAAATSGASAVCGTPREVRGKLCAGHRGGRGHRQGHRVRTGPSRRPQGGDRRPRSGRSQRKCGCRSRHVRQGGGTRAARSFIHTVEIHGGLRHHEGCGAGTQRIVAGRLRRRGRYRHGRVPGIRQQQHRQKHRLRRDDRRTAGACPGKGRCGVPAPQLHTGGHPKAIVKAVKAGPAVLPITAESRIGYAMHRISPSMLRLFARFDIRQA